jgi:hypothetical protein
VGFGVAGLGRNGIALYNIFTSLGSFDELPFQSPILWLDMALVSELLFSNKRSRPLGFLALVIGVFMYGICLWLAIGYSVLGYGTKQYQTLNVPPYCQSLGVSWQTDPRRRYFVGLQVLIFISATAGLVISYFIYDWLEKRRERLEEQQRELERTAEERRQRIEDQRFLRSLDAITLTPLELWAKRFGEWKKGLGKKVQGWFSRSNANAGPRPPRTIPILPKIGKFNGLRIPLKLPTAIVILPKVWKFPGLRIPLQLPKRIPLLPQVGAFPGLEIPLTNFRPPELSEVMHVVVMTFVLAPLLAAVGISAALNWNSYLILGQEGCYGSYVSGRWGYLDLEFLDIKIRVDTLLGINT